MRERETDRRPQTHKSESVTLEPQHPPATFCSRREGFPQSSGEDLRVAGPPGGVGPARPAVVP